MDINVTVLSGRMGMDPNLKTFQSGGQVVEWRMAVGNREKKNGEWVETSTWVDCKMFGPRAEHFARFHPKGARCLIRGEYRVEVWQDKKTGANRYKPFIRVDDFTLIEPKKAGGSTGGYSSAPAGNDTFGAPQEGAGDFTGIDNTPF